MYTALLFVLIGVAALIFMDGVKKRKPLKAILGFLIGILTIGLFWFMGFLGEALWFINLGYGGRFWTEIISNSIFAILGILIGFGLLYFLTFFLPQKVKFLRYLGWIIGAVVGGVWGYSNWDIILKFWEKIPTKLLDPIFGLSTGFYLFTLPFLDNLYDLLFMLTFIGFAASFIAAFVRYNPEGIYFYIPPIGDISTKKLHNSLYINSAAFIIVLAFGKFLDKYHLMYSSKGVVSGPGWTDVHVLVPAYNIIVVLMIIISIAILIPFIRNKIKNLLVKFRITPANAPIYIIGASAATIVLFWFLGLSAIPSLFESLMVQPNEITYERPYISNNIKFTRYGFGLDKVEEKEFPVTGNFTINTVKNNPSIFKNVRLWDWRALDAVYRQFQEIRLYYEFSSVNVDRYNINGKYRQVMVSGREINIDNLPIKSQTFVNKRFQYTHGYGITMATVNQFTPQGLPHLLIKNIPPVSEYPGLDIKQPQIYYGELTKTYVIVNSKEKEFDYPSGEENIYTRYSGKGGVRISGLWRKFLFGWKFGGTKLLFSDYPTDSSRIMFHRQIRERVKLLAPFLKFDNDPYIVLDNGKLYWIIDAYTSSTYFPYSEPFNSLETIDYKEGNTAMKLRTIVDKNFNGVNYIRNSIKVVINAFNGSVNFYILDKKDPIVKVWQKIYPDLFKAKSQMPEGLLAHIRYPIDMLLAQGLVYEKYHMTDPTVFYNQEDLWVRATEKYYNHVQPVEPYYIIWQLPGSTKPQFSLILPFTPKNRQVLIGWIAGLCDSGNYGRFLAYQFPKNKMILGPQQVESKIDQDSYLSGQLTLWNQRGSNVIRGNVLAIPVNNTLFYVEPIYLQAETAAYPELRLVVVMHGNDMSYAKTFDQALTKLFASSTNKVVTQQLVPQKKSFSFETLAKQANDAFNNYLKYSGEKRFSDAAKELAKLQKALKQLAKSVGAKKNK